MNALTARDAMSEQTASVNAAAGVKELAETGSWQHIYSVFAEGADTPDQRGFLGLVTGYQIAEHPHATFRDLLPKHPVDPVIADMPLRKVLQRMEAAALDALPVVDERRKFIGVITRASLTSTLLSRERELLEKYRLYKKKAKEDNIRLAEGVERLEQLNRTFRRLMELLARPSGIELFQRGIETLAAIIQVRWGAVNIVEESGRIKETVFTGSTPGEPQMIQKFLEQRKMLVEMVVTENKIIRTPDVPQYLKQCGFPIRHPTLRAFLGVPLAFEGRVYGCVYLCEKTGEPFSEEDESLASSFAQALALGLAEARERAARKRAEEALRRREKQYRDLVNDVDAIIWEADAHSLQTTFVSRRAQEILGYPVEDWLSGPEFRREHFSALDRDRVWGELQAAVSQGRDFEGEYRFMAADGRTMWFHDIARIVWDEEDHPSVIRGVMVDITERKETERERELLSSLGLQLAGADTPEKVGDIVRSITEQFWNWDAFFISVRRAGFARFFIVIQVDTEHGEKKVYPPSEHAVSHFHTMGALMRGEPVLINRTTMPDVPKLTPFGEEYRPSACMIYAPVRVEGEVVGIMSVQSYTPGLFGEQDRDRLQRIADVVGPALARCQAEKRSAAFAALGLRLSTASSPEEAAQTIVDAADALLGWDACSVYLTAPDELSTPPILHMDMIDGKRVNVPADPSQPLTPLAKRTIEDGPQLILRDKLEFGGADLVPFGDTSRPSASLMFVPLRTSSGIIGILSIQSYSFNAYDKRDLKMLQNLADHCSGALERTKIERALRYYEQQLRAMVENLPEPSAICNVKGRISRVNLGLAGLLGYRAEEMAAKPLGQFLQVDKAWTSRSEDDPAVLKDAAQAESVMMRRKDGQTFASKLNIRPLKTASGESVGTLFSVTELVPAGENHG